MRISVPRRWILAAAAGFLAIAQTACGTEPASTEGLLARAGPYTLTTEHAAAILAPVASVPARDAVVQSFADLWVDLTLLADAMARDTTLSQLDLTPVARVRLEQELAFSVEDTLIPRDTAVSEEELQRRYAREAPEVRITAAHILFKEPLAAREEERDSVRARADEVRRLAQAGEDFGDLARRFSQDPGTAGVGGSLGTFGRGSVAPELEDAALALPIGEVSEPIRSAFGYHLLVVSAREAVGYAQGRAAFRAQVVAELRQQADSTFWAVLMERAELEVAEGAVARTRQLAAHATLPLSWRGRREVLVAGSEETLTAEEVRLLFQARPRNFLEAMEHTDSAHVAEVLLDFARRELLLAWARERGEEVDEGEVRSLAQEARRQVAETATRMMLRVPAGTRGDERHTAVGEVVASAMRRIVAGDLDPVPLGQVAMRLREEAGAGVFDDGVRGVVERVQAERARD